MKRTIFLILGFFVWGHFSSTVAQQAARPFIGVYADSVSRLFNNATYAAGDVVTDSVGGAMLFTDDWSRGAIVGASITVDTLNATNGTFRLFFFSDTTGLGALTDNSAFSPTAAKLANLIGVADFTLVTTGTASATSVYAVNRDFRIFFASASGIYGVLTATGAWVPKQNAQMKIRIVIAPE